MCSVLSAEGTEKGPEGPVLCHSSLVAGLQTNERPLSQELDGISEGETLGCPLSYMCMHIYIHTCEIISPNNISHLFFDNIMHISNVS